MFGLKHIKTGKIVGFYSTENDKRDFCVSRSFYLSLEDDHPTWSAEDIEAAEKVKQSPKTPWNRASLHNPSHNFDPDDLEVIKL
jgi:hypothetical protein